jgi:hypothetical protein
MTQPDLFANEAARVQEEAKRILDELPADPHAVQHRNEMEQAVFNWKALAWRPWCP